MPPRSPLSLLPLLTLCLGVKSALFLPGAAEDCSQQDLSCSVSFSNCLDPGWIQSYDYTPPGPESLDLKIVTRLDPEGFLLPVISATWRLRDDSGIKDLKASELQVLTAATNQYLCVRFTYKNTLKMRNLQGDQWTLHSDHVVVDPGQVYSVSLENVPKAEEGHNNYGIHRNITVPDCSDAMMKTTRPCIEEGYHWTPNIEVSASDRVLSVEFSPDPLTDKYLVLLHCGLTDVAKKPTPVTAEPTALANTVGSRVGSRLTASFSLEPWTCCRLSAEVLGHFPRCGHDCRRHRKEVSLCRTQQERAGDPEQPPLPVVLSVSLVVIFIIIIIFTVVTCRKKRSSQPLDLEPPVEKQLQDQPTVLLIYSRDHPLFVDVVLKLTGFLQAHCGVKVLLDLLDSCKVSQFGVVRWLELQRRSLSQNDKVLVLCSRGVQSKWRALCGQGHVTQQPDDLIGPFVSLCLSELHSPQTRSRYLPVFFEALSSEEDVPSFFDVSVKYKLMKHLEELFFRLIEKEKYQPKTIHHVQGLGPDQVCGSASGRALMQALTTFSAFQALDPDWFETHDPECETTPILRDTAHISMLDVWTNQSAGHLYVTEPELQPGLNLALNTPLLQERAPEVFELLPHPERRPEEVLHPERRPEEVPHPERRPEEVPHPERRPEEVLHPERRPEEVPHPERRPEEVLHPERRPEEVLHPERPEEQKGVSDQGFTEEEVHRGDQGFTEEEVHRGGDQGFTEEEVHRGGDQGFTEEEVHKGGDQGFTEEEVHKGGDQGFTEEEVHKEGDQGFAEEEVHTGGDQGFAEEEVRRGGSGEGSISSASDQGYTSHDPDSDHMRALLRLQQELMSHVLTTSDP
ncbi:unnamed protein product [Knipowitschia caucasica]